MSWMNRLEIDSAVQGCQLHSVLGPATRFLESLMNAVDDQSDGWPYWSAPSKASAQLQELIQKNTFLGSPSDAANVTLRDVEKTLIPIRRMVTVQQKKQKAYGNTFEFNVDAEWDKACKNTPSGEIQLGLF